MINPFFYDIIVSPVITEKSTFVSENNQVIFYVSKKSTKVEIKEAIQKIFSVRVIAVNTLIKKGKVKNFRRVKARQQDVKKAIITLAEGEIIDISEKI